jgi:hypothetical protein
VDLKIPKLRKGLPLAGTAGVPGKIIHRSEQAPGRRQCHIRRQALIPRLSCTGSDRSQPRWPPTAALNGQAHSHDCDSGRMERTAPALCAVQRISPAIATHRNLPMTI